MIRHSAAIICIFMLIFNIAYINAQDNEDKDTENPIDIEVNEEILSAVEEQNEPDTLNTAVAEEESLSVGIKTDVEKDSLPALQEELPKKQFKGTAKDVVLAAASIIGWLFFMWLTANQRE